MVKTLVVKVGTSTLTNGTPRLSKPHILDLVRQLATLHHSGTRVLLVTSGAMAAGREQLGGRNFSSALPVKQMLSSIGQGYLMRLYSDLFQLYDVRVGQVLITGDDIRHHRSRYLNARDTLNMLLEYRVLPIINENDTVAVEEIKVGDNDNLSAYIASLVNADLLLLLTDQDGLYSQDPRHFPEATRIKTVTEISASIRALASADSSSGLGVGGMLTKLEAAERAGRSGIETVIASGRMPDVVLRVMAGEEVGTRILPPAPRVESRKRWLLLEPPEGVLIVDEGAATALQKGEASLLPVGIRRVTGSFGRGALLRIETEGGAGIAHGLSNYSSDDLVRLCGLRSQQIEAVLGYTHGEVAVHRDHLALLKAKRE